MRRILISFLAATCASAALAAEAREVSGSAAYRERIALPPDAELVVEITGFQGTELATLHQQADGKQVPLPFAIEMPSGLKAELHAAILLDNAVRWVSEPIEIAAGDEAIDLGTVQLSGYVPSGFQTTYICGDQRFEIGYDENGAVVESNDWIFNLPQAISADGAKFSSPDGQTVFWSKGSGAMLTIKGKALPECEALSHENIRPWLAQGNEPGWQASILNDRLSLNLNYGSDQLDLTLPEARIEGGAYHYDYPQLGLSVSIQDKQCSDDMTGRPYPQTVNLTFADDRTLRGCGGDTMSLLAGDEWSVDSIAGEAVKGDGVPTLNISEGARISGLAGCNRYMGAFAMDGEGNLEIGSLAATSMACTGNLMSVEDRFLEALGSAEYLRLDENGKLILLSGGEPVITASR